ncbi:hypothetical protein J8TS2_23310 [Lederbergia ruris]|uniref:Uncharacterized protein n=1 Tax=Lederbergia ruris TaxID=217495 RepID=A0ABQ4KJD3_9BACI|nr:hypothetical protein J8TS2_23310 [Lederbergia ruris]
MVEPFGNVVKDFFKKVSLRLAKYIWIHYYNNCVSTRRGRVLIKNIIIYIFN